jgi:hypothetical protein
MSAACIVIHCITFHFIFYDLLCHIASYCIIARLRCGLLHYLVLFWTALYHIAGLVLTDNGLLTFQALALLVLDCPYFRVLPFV